METHWLNLLSSIGIAVGGAIAVVYALISGFKKKTDQAHEETDRARSELSQVLKMEAEAWKARYESEHAEFVHYRDETHAKNNESNGKILVLTEENAQLRSKTDLSPIIAFQQEQTKINSRVLAGLEVITEKLISCDRPPSS